MCKDPLKHIHMLCFVGCTSHVADGPMDSVLYSVKSVRMWAESACRWIQQVQGINGLAGGSRPTFQQNLSLCAVQELVYDLTEMFNWA